MVATLLENWLAVRIRHWAPVLTPPTRKPSMPRKYKPLATSWYGRPCAVEPEVAEAWDRAHEALQPRCWLRELAKEYYQLRTPWGITVTVTESGLGLESRCCDAILSWQNSPVLRCSTCQASTPIPSQVGIGATWPHARDFLETVLVYLGQDVLTATLNAEIVSALEDLARSPKRLQSV